MNTESNSVQEPRPLRVKSRFQFGLRHALVAMAVLCVGFAVIAIPIQQNRIIREWSSQGVAAEFQGFSLGLFFWNYGEAFPITEPLWQDVLAQREIIHDLNLYKCVATDSDIEGLAQLKNLQILNLAANPGITDRTGVQLAGLEKLESLTLARTAITDQTVEAICVLEHLETLRLDSTPISDAALGHLDKLPSLRHLTLRGTAITDQGVAELTKCAKLDWLVLDDCNLTFEGLRTLSACPQLKYLEIAGFLTLSPAEFNELQREMPRVEIYYDQIRDIDAISESFLPGHWVTKSVDIDPTLCEISWRDCVASELVIERLEGEELEYFHSCYPVQGPYRLHINMQRQGMTQFTIAPDCDPGWIDTKRSVAFFGIGSSLMFDVHFQGEELVLSTEGIELSFVREE